MNTREVESKLRCSGGKRVSKIKNCFISVCHNKRDTKLSTGYRWALFLIFQLFIALLVVQPNAWAGLLGLSVDANGDNVFNGQDDGEKLIISFTTSDFGDASDEFGQGGQQYNYTITVDGTGVVGAKTIASGPETDSGDKLAKNQTVQYVWDGMYFKKGDEGDREKLPDGDYTITVKLTGIPALPLGQVSELTAQVTVDSKAPEVTISIDDDAFSPDLYSLAVYYDIDEDVSEAWLEFQRAPGNANIGRRVPLSTTSGSHTYNWDGEDNNRRAFFDGQYTLRIRVKDKGGNDAESGKTGNITIDTEEPRITSITLNDSIALTNGKFVNAPITTINFTADDPDGTGVNLTGRDTEVLIRPVDGRNLNGAMTFGNKATFTLGDILDELDENGEYEVTAFISDNVGNLASSRVRFTFDNSVPILKSVATQSGEFVPGSGISGLTNYIEATLEDNIELNLADSTIRLKGPSGGDVLGQQTRSADDKIRWQLLSPLLAKDGIHDGQYTVEIVASDKAGNQTTPIQITFLFDNIAPELVSVSPTRDGEAFNILGDTVYYNLPLNQFVATFDDGEFGTGVIFSGADDISRIIFGTPKTDGGVDAISGRAFPDLNNNVLTYILDDPLLNSDGSQDGSYRLNVKASDPLGNNQIYSFHLIYDTQVPTLVSTVPAANQSVQDLSQVVVKLNETTSGIDFVQSVFALKRNTGETQVEVPVNISSDGTDTATLTLLQPIALDGSDDGTYIIEVTPTDRAGNLGSVVRREFYLVSQARPQVKLLTPETGTVNSLGDITVELVGYIGSGINFDASTITVRNALGQIVPQAEVAADAATNQLTWSTETAIPKGTADGRYTITASFRDYSGVVIAQTFNLNLDTLSPSITSVQVGTDALNQLSLDSTIDVTEAFSHINIEFDATDVDFENTVVTLVDPDSNEIAARKSIDGETLLTLSFQNLAKLGSYTLTVIPIDNIGNVTASPFIYKFNIDIAVPVVTSVLIDGQSGAIVYVKGTAGEIIATIADTTGIGIAVGQGGSNIGVTSESGLPVPGITTIDDENRLVWRPSVLPSDGSADGRYTISVTPVDKAGRTGDVAYRAFIYDTQSPQITAAAPISLYQPISYVGDGLEQFQFSVEDVGPALLDLDDQTISLTKESGEIVAGHITHDNNNQLFFTLPAPLPTDGSADGEYTVTVNLVDKAGNPYQVEYTVVYDSQAPQLASVSLNTETPSNLTAYQVTDLSGSISKITLKFIEMTRIDFDNTVITLMSPDGSTIPLTLENNGIDEITANFVSLIQDGLYTLSVTPQDISGNVAQGAVPYPFRQKFEVPGITTVHANSVSASYELASYEIMDISDAINSFSLKFTDAERIDFENTSVTLTSPNGQDITVSQEESGSNQFLVRFIPLIQSGLYTLSVTPQDIAGNVAQSPIQYQFRLEITLPAVSSVLIDGKLGTNILINDPDTEIVATFADATGVGLAFGDSGSTITVNSEQGFAVSGILSSNGTNQVTWTPAALPTDGSADGRYTVTITPVDKSGRTGPVVNRHFIYDTQAPRITNATPIILHQPMSYIGGNLTSIEFTVEDVGPSLLELDDQTITLDKDGAEAVAGQVTHDGVNRLFFTPTPSLSTDGSADGEYTLTINLIDKAGNTNQTTHTIHYDSQVPRISSVSLNTETPIDLTPYQVTDLSASINKLTINFVETTQVNFAATVITLTGPGNSSIPLTIENNGTDQLTASFVTLAQGGLYTLSVTPQDIAGNVAQGAVSYPFRLKFEIPGLASVKANTVDASFELISYEIVETTESVSSFTLEFTDGTRIDLESTEVVLTGPNGQQIPLTLTEDGDAKLDIRFVSLEQNGMYTLSVTPQDIAGNTAQGAVSYSFRLKLEIPGVASVTANSADDSLQLIQHAIVETSELINNLTLEFTDPLRVDFENTNVSLRGPDGQEIPVTLEDNDSSQLIVRFVPLEQSGLYTLSVTPQDNAGNIAQNAVSYQFRLEFDMPEISSVKVNTASTSLDITPYEIVELSELVEGFTLEFTNGSRVDFENTSVVLTGPDGQQIPIILEDDDEATLSVRFVALEQSGLYTLSVTPQDIDGAVAQNAVSYQFRLEFDMPEIASVKVNTTDTSLDITPYEVVELSEPVGGFTLEFTNGSRVDFENTSAVLTGPDGQQIPIILEDDDDATLSVRFVALEQSGLYTLSVTPQDIDGAVAQNAVSYQFRLEFDMPEIASVKVNTADTSLDLTPYEIFELSVPVGGFTLEFTNGSRVDFENTSVVLTGPDGQQIPIILEDDDDATLSVRFVALEQSGLYTLSVTPQDIDSTVAQNAVSYQLRLKFEVPDLESVTAHADDTSVVLIQHDVVEISESIGSLTLKFTDAQRVDLENTSVTLTGPNGQEILVTLEDNENSQLTVRFVPLTQSGIYTISVTPQDIAGNVAQTAIRYQFRLDTTLPSVNSVLIDGKVGSTVYVRISVPRIIASITDSLGVGLSVGDTGSTIVVTNSQGIQVSGTTTLNAANQLTWTPIPLPVDGSADGEYTVVITPVDKAGRTGTVVRRQFIYDTQAPRITSATPITLHAPISYLGSGLNQFVLTVEDVGPADIVYASQVVALMDATGKPVPAKLTYDELTNQLYLTLDTPFASDGTADGPYTLNVLLIDKAGNRLTTRFNLVYDSIIPQVSSVQVNTAGTPIELSPSQVAELSESVDTITIKFNEATRVDFENTSILLLDPNDQTIPFTVGDDGVSQMTLSFVALTQIGQYTLFVTPQDIAGNAAQSPIQYAFILEFILPDVESVIIGDTVTLGSGDAAYVNAENLVIVANLLDPAGTGLSFDPITGSEIIVATLDGIIVPGSVATNGTDLLVWRPITLSNDGSSDGRYAVYVYAVDKKGREASAVYREFVYDTQEPEITNASPMDLSQPVSYISESLTQFQFTIQDVGPADLMLEDQVVTLRNQSGVLVPTKLTNDTNNQLFLTLDEPLPLDGSRDGEYTVEIAFSDRSKNVLSINHPIVYDTQAPTLVSTVPADNEQLTEDITQIQVSLDDKGESGIDWSRTTVTLIDPNGITISGDLSSDGKSQLTLKTNQLVADGRYVIQVQAIDRAGNGGRTVHESDFLLSRLLPAIVSTVPTTAPEDEAYTNEKVEEIEVLLETVDVRHLSTVRLLTSEGQVVAGQQHRETDKLIYRLVRPLATDGSEDGDYTIEFTPISSSGRSGAAQSLVFIYDTQSPELDPKDVHLIVAEQQVDNSLIRIRLDITDNHAGVDWENLDTEWVTFERVSPNSTDIDGSVLYVSDEPEHLLFTLNVPLADDGSADGKYRITVTPIDKAGNGNETYEKEFTYDTSPPIIDPNSLLLNDAPLLTDIDADDYPSAVSTIGGVVIQAVVSDTGLGVNLSESRIVVRNPNGQELSGTTRQNGVDTLVFKSDGLNIQGIYQVTVTATGNDTELLGITPQGSITTAFLYETTEPTAVVTDDGGKTELTDEALPLIGTAADPEGTRRAGQQGENEIPVPASGVWLVEIVGIGPDGQPIEPVPAEDDSDAQQEPWSRWKVDFLPTRSGDYDLDIRVTDRAGNYAVYDYGEVTMSVSFTFSGNTFAWPNPLRQSNDDVGFFSYELNTSDDTVKLNLYIYDWSGDMVYSKTYDRINPKHRNGNEVSWQLKNSAGNRVARGIYVFRLEAVDGAGNRANAVGKILVVD